MATIPKRLVGLLSEVANKHNLVLSWKGVETELDLDREHSELLREHLGTEFCEAGLTSNDEPNSRGIDIEELIDLLGH